jgi:hypothetical protein
MNVELNARRTAAVAVLGDYKAEVAWAALTTPPGREWMLRLASVLGDLLAALDRPTATPVTPTGSQVDNRAFGPFGTEREALDLPSSGGQSEGPISHDYHRHRRRHRRGPGAPRRARPRQLPPRPRARPSGRQSVLVQRERAVRHDARAVRDTDRSQALTESGASGSSCAPPATVQVANDLSDAGIAVVQVAEPLPDVTPDVQSAIADVEAVQGDCAALTG